MSKNIIYDPEVRINNQTIATVAGTITVKFGQGESTVKPQSSGNGAVEMVYSEDVDTKTSMIKFSVYSIADKLDLILELKQNRGNNYIALNDSGSNTNYVFNDVALTNDPEIGLGNDGQAELEFSGSPVV